MTLLRAVCDNTARYLNGKEARPDPLKAHEQTFQDYPGKKAMLKAKIQELLNDLGPGSK